MTRYAISAAAAALAAGFLLQVHPFSGHHNIRTPTVAPPTVGAATEDLAALAVAVMKGMLECSLVKNTQEENQ